MITDDARIVDAKACQVESWVRKNQDSTEYWALPSCNFSGNLELTAGGARTSDDAGTSTTAAVLQAKTLFRPLSTNDWGIGVAAGTIRRPNLSGEREWYAYIPASLSLKDDRVVLHANLGWVREQNTAQHKMTWGLSSELQMSARSWLVLESFGQNQGKPYYHAGVRFWVVPNHAQIDATVGNRVGSGSSDRWVSIGLRLLSLPFL